VTVDIFALYQIDSAPVVLVSLLLLSSFLTGSEASARGDSRAGGDGHFVFCVKMEEEERKKEARTRN